MRRKRERKVQRNKTKVQYIKEGKQETKVRTISLCTVCVLYVIWDMHNLENELHNYGIPKMCAILRMCTETAQS